MSVGNGAGVGDMPSEWARCYLSGGDNRKHRQGVSGALRGSVRAFKRAAVGRLGEWLQVGCTAAERIGELTAVPGLWVNQAWAKTSSTEAVT
ncbi:MAG: hypothetical protein ACI9DC_000577 [Gammaproteobacteria bacterium]|jgi:hypothetical protein